MNMTPFIARRMNKTSRGVVAGNDKFADVLIAIVIGCVVLFACTILFLLVLNIFATFETVSAESMTVVNRYEDTVPKYDEYFVSLSNGETYEVSKHTYSNLTVGDEIEVAYVIKHLWIGNIKGVRILDEFIETTNTHP